MGLCTGRYPWRRKIGTYTEMLDSALNGALHNSQLVNPKRVVFISIIYLGSCPICHDSLFNIRPLALILHTSMPWDVS